MQYKVYLSFMEIYKEKCKDLLIKRQKVTKGLSADEQEKTEYTDLKIRHSPDKDA